MPLQTFVELITKPKVTFDRFTNYFKLRALKFGDPQMDGTLDMLIGGKYMNEYQHYEEGYFKLSILMQGNF